MFYKFKVLRNSRLRLSILQDAITEIGKIKEYEREVNLNADQKRFWLGNIESLELKKMNNSVPISMRYFKNY